ncbi:hypothetical protein RUM43_003831 [Polyplax serrata]|uniref:Kinetochore protein SPC25 n=1 Tax=Polyplax serrata TaxID=468196 RepID=A0AAN8S8D9_POLSC
MQKEKELYLKKIEELSRKIEESKTQLLGLEGTISDLRKKHSYQSQVNEELKEQFETLQLSIKEKNENFTKTLDNYTTVINYYENYLNMSLDLDKDNHNIVTIKFTNLQSDSQVQIEAIDNATFKILKAHPLLNDEKITERIISKPELMLLLYNTQKQVKGCST